ncbi:MAG TPA: hypothetical protein VH280_21205 [Verrucomicrobiae bacterium]|jgi:hypothetical protein|nr:hypothetical protein [Verrucomicrobiae bacterium]
MPERQDAQLGGYSAQLKRVWTNLLEYGRLVTTLAKLYVQSRVLMLQNYLLSCRLRMWDAAFVYFKLQIFFIRLSNGFPLDRCWPAEESLPPVSGR